MNEDDRLESMIPREPEWSKMRGVGPRGSGIILIVLGLLVVVLGLIQYVDGRRSSSWPSVTGWVEQTEVVRRSEATGRQRTYHHAIRVTYAYRVGNATYRNNVRQRGFSWLGGDPHFFGRFDSPEQAAEAAEKSYPAGSEVEVYYDPERPRASCLATGYGRARKAVFGGLSVVLVGLGLFVWGSRVRSRRP